MDKQKVIELIAKMSTLTEDSGAFQGEIAAASAKIQQLMDKHAIEWNDIHGYRANKQEKEMSKVFTSKMSDFQHGSLKKWYWQLARVIARATHTRHYSWGKRMTFFGVEQNAEIASQLYLLWLGNIDQMSKKAKKESFAELRKQYPELIEQYGKNIIGELNRRYPELGTQYFTQSWISGCIAAMNENLREQEVQREEVSTNAITLYKEEVDKEYSKMSKGFKTVNTSSSSGFSGIGYAKGREAGSNISLGSKPIGSGRKQLKG